MVVKNNVKKLNVYSTTGSLVFTAISLFSGIELQVPDSMVNGLYIFQFLDNNNTVLQTSKVINNN